MHTAEPEPLSCALNGHILIHQQRDVGGRQDRKDRGCAKKRVVIAHHGEALLALDFAHHFGAAVHRSQDEVAQHRGKADEVARKKYEIRVQRIDFGDDSAQKGWLRKAFEVNIGNLDDAEVVEGVGEIANRDGVGENAELVACNLAGI